MHMTPREREMAALRREEPDRVPIFEFMIDPKVIDGILPGGTYEDLVEAVDIDCVVTHTPSRMYSLELVRHDASTPVYRTEWGELRAETTEMVTIPVAFPRLTRTPLRMLRAASVDKCPSIRRVVQDIHQRSRVGLRQRSWPACKPSVCRLGSSFKTSLPPWQLISVAWFAGLTAFRMPRPEPLVLLRWLLILTFVNSIKLTLGNSVISSIQYPIQFPCNCLRREIRP
jgi:hypothetical protein